MKNLKLTLSVAILLLSACKVQNQNIMTDEARQTTNPIPFMAANLANLNHKVLVAIIDTGVDYNHPKLKENIHYTMTKGRVTGVGYDYTANDEWASPYLAPTAQLYEDEMGHKKEVKIQKGVSEFLALYPQFERYMKNRGVDEEKGNGIYHGTHVAGLASYDNPAIGLLPYRVLPFNNYSRHDSYTVKSDFEVLSEAIERAALDGAKIVNMSLGGSFKKKDPTYNSAMKEINKMARLIESHPEMLFVVAAGNDGKWTDGISHVNYPCGIKAPNILCVGSLDKDGDLSDFTNIPVNTNLLVFTLGEDLISTMPTLFCNIEFDGLEYPAYDELATKIEKNCIGKKNEYAPLSGTSMATPLVAHMAAEVSITNPSLNGSELIAELKKMATTTDLGGFKALKLKIKKPSWYNDKSVNPSGNLKSVGGSRFEFIFR